MDVLGQQKRLIEWEYLLCKYRERLFLDFYSSSVRMDQVLYLKHVVNAVYFVLHAKIWLWDMW